jgi:hypothetical protein
MEKYKDKSRKARVEEQQIIYDFVQKLEFGASVAAHESVGSEIKFTRHDGYTFSIKVPGKKQKLVLTFEVQDIEDSNKDNSK